MSWKLGIQDDALSVSPIKWNIPKEIIQYSFRINKLDKLISSISECVSILLGCRANLFFLRLGDSFASLNAKGTSWEYKLKEIHLQVPCDLTVRLGTTPGYTYAFCCPASQCPMGRVHSLQFEPASLPYVSKAWLGLDKKIRCTFIPAGPLDLPGFYKITPDLSKLWRFKSPGFVALFGVALTLPLQRDWRKLLSSHPVKPTIPRCSHPDSPKSLTMHSSPKFGSLLQKLDTNGCLYVCWHCNFNRFIMLEPSADTQAVTALARNINHSCSVSSDKGAMITNFSSKNEMRVFWM